MRMQLYGSIILGLLAATAAEAKTLYVDGARGNDAVTYANNSEGQPWRSLGRALWGNTSRTAQRSSEAARAGDVVIVAAGVYETTAGTGHRYDPIYNPVNSGAAGSPIVIRAASPGAVSLRSTQSPTAQPIIGTYGRQHIVWDGFNIDEQYVPTARDTGPVVVWNSSDVTLQNLIVRGVNRNWVDNHNGIRLEQVNRIIVRNNLVTGYRESQHGMNASAITMYNTREALIENNEFTQANTGVYVKAYIEGPVTVRRNLIRDVSVGVIIGRVGEDADLNPVSTGADVYNNVITDAWAGVSFIGYDNVTPANVNIANNTILRTSGGDGGAILFRTQFNGYRNIRVFNNILGRSEVGVTAWENSLAAMSLSFNAFYNNQSTAEVAFNSYSLAEWQTRFQKDVTGSRQADPGFVNEAANDLRLRDTSSLLRLAPDRLDVNRNGSTTDLVNLGAYAAGNEAIGRITGPTPNPPTSVAAR